jgi:hypothetical protein
MVAPTVEGVDLFSALSGRSMRGVDEEPEARARSIKPKLEHCYPYKTTPQTTLSCLYVHAGMRLCYW